MGRCTDYIHKFHKIFFEKVTILKLLYFVSSVYTSRVSDSINFNENAISRVLEMCNQKYVYILIKLVASRISKTKLLIA